MQLLRISSQWEPHTISSLDHRPGIEVLKRCIRLRHVELQAIRDLPGRTAGILGDEAEEGRAVNTHRMSLPFGQN